MKGLTLLLLMAFSHVLQAENNLNLILTGGITFGGEKLAETTSGSSLDSGGLIYLAAGGLYEVPETNFQLQTTLGYHFDTLYADNGDADFSRTNIEIIPFYKINPTFRLGVGYTKIMSVSYSDPYDSIDFKDADGLITEISWSTSHNAWWGLRYVKTEYIVKSLNGFDIGNIGEEFPIDGDYFGLMFSFVFK